MCGNVSNMLSILMDQGVALKPATQLCFLTTAVAILHHSNICCSDSPFFSLLLQLQCSKISKVECVQQIFFKYCAEAWLEHFVEKSEWRINVCAALLASEKCTDQPSLTEICLYEQQLSFF